MRAVVVDLNLGKAALTLALSKLSKSAYYSPLSIISFRKDYPEPKLVNEKWVKIRPILAGICGSDLRLITLSESMYLLPLTSFPLVLGHEVVGIVEKAGKESNVEEGSRIVVDPALPCVVRGLEECPSCKKGNYATCYNLDRGDIAPGLFTGFCRDTGGAWADYFVAHRFQIFEVPDGIKDENAVMVEPFSIAIHAVMKAFPGGDDVVAVVGCGTIGVCVIAALRGLGFKGEIIAIDVSEAQMEMAARFGASRKVHGRDAVESIAEITGGRVYLPPREKPMFVGGGADVVFECVGNAETVDTALRIAAPQGRVVLVGTASKLTSDWAPIFSKELRVIGTFGCGLEEIGGEKRRTFDVALELMKKQDFSSLVTHEFKLEDYKKALWTAMNKGKTKAGKVVFRIS